MYPDLNLLSLTKPPGMALHPTGNSHHLLGVTVNGSMLVWSWEALIRYVITNYPGCPVLGPVTLVPRDILVGISSVSVWCVPTEIGGYLMIDRLYPLGKLIYSPGKVQGPEKDHR